MKKIVIFTILSILFLFASNTVARVVDDGDGTVTVVGKLVISGAPLIPSDACTGPCKTCPSWQYGLSIDGEPEYCTCPTFDYELGDGDGASGYFPGQNVNGVLFMLNDCDYPGFSADELYAIRLTIMEPAGGVYFTDRNFSNSNNNHACAVDLNGDKIEVVDGEKKIYISSHPSPLEGCATYCIDSCGTDSVDYALEYLSSTSDPLYSLSENASTACCFTWAVQPAKTVQTTHASFLQADKPLLLIDLPTFVYDPEIVYGSTVTVKVEIIVDDGEGLVMTFCECIVRIGTFE